jgi:signal transduction histidine kinase
MALEQQERPVLPSEWANLRTKPLAAQPDELVVASRAAELARINESLQRRERMLAASARGSRLLLEAPDVMAVVPEVLRRIGEAAGVDRVNIMLAQTGPAGERLLQVASEWVAEGVVSRLGHPTMSCCDESTYANEAKLLRDGQSLILNTPEELDCGCPGGFEGVGTKSKAIVPIFVDGDFIGVVGFDNVRQRRAIDTAELSALETAAGVIGAALHRERLVDAVRRERERASEARVAALAKANAAIRGNLERLANTPNLAGYMGSMLVDLTRQLDAASASVIVLDDAAEKWRVIAYVRDGRSEEPTFATSVARTEARFDERLRSAREPIYLDLEVPGDVEMVWPGTIELKRADGYRSLYIVPLVFGARTVGCIGLSFRRRDPISAQSGELLIALAQQATLAIELTRLADSETAAAVLGERNRIGREIHDGLAQAFTGILMQLAATEESKACARGALRTTLDRIRDLARDGLAEARRSVMALGPDHTRRGGLGLALQQLAERSTVRGGVTCTFEGNGAATGLAPEHEHEMLRIAQEAVSNAVRHARPAAVRLVLTEEPGHWLLAVIDDGTGMQRNPERHAQQGFGLTNMRERASAIGAEWHITTEWGAGTRVSVRVPKRKQR